LNGFALCHIGLHGDSSNEILILAALLIKRWRGLCRTSPNRHLHILTNAFADVKRIFSGFG
ncbi:MAG: hypothetical protein IJI85_01325, partial [Clostridia bacterium]|nr:hypothetical protein [Clostridia bacterium]MBR0421208.1 hypothetical protein [Clostridia bacterium]